jgi:glycosyltransferase involved in cell wall biosynthesis
MACGVPVIAVDEAGYKETVVNNKTGILIKRDPQELVKAIRKLTNNKNRLQLYEKNSRELALSQWSWKKSVTRMEKIMQRRVGRV